MLTDRAELQNPQRKSEQKGESRGNGIDGLKRKENKKGEAEMKQRAIPRDGLAMKGWIREKFGNFIQD